MKRLIVALLMFAAPAFAANGPDSLVVTGPSFQQIPLGQMLITPTGGAQATLSAALSAAAGGCTTGCTFAGNTALTGNQLTVGTATPGTFFINAATTNNIFFGFSTSTQEQFRINGTDGTNAATIFNVQTSTAGTTTVDNSLSLSPGGTTPVPGEHGFIMNNVWTGTNTGYAMNVLQANDQIAGGGNVLSINQVINTATATGQKFAFLSTVNVTGLSGNGSTYPGGIYVAGGTGAAATVNDGGSTSGFGTPNHGSGSLFGWNPGALLHCTSGNPSVQPCATGWAGVNGTEIDVQTDAFTSTNTRLGLDIGLSDAAGTQGQWEDIALGLGHVQNQAASSGWKTGLMFGFPQAGFPMDPTGTMIGAGPVTSGTMLAAYGMDFSLVTFSSGFLKSSGFLVDGTGNMTAASYANLQDIQTFTAAGTWTKPAWCANAGVTCVTHLRLIGGGPGGGGGAQETFGTVGSGGASGGGASCIDVTAPSTKFSATVAVAIGAGGAGGAGGTSGVGTVGSAGANSTFGAYYTAFTGGAGAGGQTAAASGGGASGGVTGSGQAGSGTTAGVGGGTNGTTGGGSSNVGSVSPYGTGNASGGGATTTASNGGVAAPCVGGAATGGTLLVSSASNGGAGGGAFGGSVPSGGASATTGTAGAGTNAVGDGALFTNTTGPSGGGANTGGTGGAGGGAATGAYGCAGAGGGSGTVAGGAGGTGCSGYVVAVTTGN